MKSKGIPFEEVFDLFAIRIIIETPPELEKPDCWRIYSIVTDYYQPSPERLRDWVSTNKSKWLRIITHNSYVAKKESGLKYKFAQKEWI